MQLFLLKKGDRFGEKARVMMTTSILLYTITLPLFGKPRQIPIAIATFRAFPAELDKAPRIYYGGAHLKVTDRKTLSFFLFSKQKRIF